jgi:hypothetical protein
VTIVTWLLLQVQIVAAMLSRMWCCLDQCAFQHRAAVASQQAVEECLSQTRLVRILSPLLPRHSPLIAIQRMVVAFVREQNFAQSDEKTSPTRRPKTTTPTASK